MLSGDEVGDAAQILSGYGSIRFLLAGAGLLVSLTGAMGCTASFPGTSSGSSSPAKVRSPEAGMWISRAEVKRLPMVGPAWDAVKFAADGDLGVPQISDQKSGHDVNTLAVALVYARTGDRRYREKAADAIWSAVRTERGGTVLALARNLLSYVIAADLIDFKAYDRARERRFRSWLMKVRNAPLGSKAVEDQTLIGSHERAANNVGGMAGASRVAVAVYLQDERDLARAAQVMKGWLGDRSAYAGIPAPEFGKEDVGMGHRFGGSKPDLSWQVDREAPVGVNPQGATKRGHSIDGALPEDMRRGDPFRWPPTYTQYPREALSGYVAMAELLYRQGYPVYGWSDRALLRATRFLWQLDRAFPGQNWWEPEIPIYWVVNYRYRQRFPVADSTALGRNVGWTSWTHSSERH
ncbi:MAG TPA: hypothetical protein VES61_02770 [Gaiellaceae bacterium]|nr:hypothetical protein [Gaiellaceae bacterium]